MHGDKISQLSQRQPQVTISKDTFAVKDGHIGHSAFCFGNKPFIFALWTQTFELEYILADLADYPGLLRRSYAPP